MKVINKNPAPRMDSNLIACMCVIIVVKSHFISIINGEINRKARFQNPYTCAHTQSHALTCTRTHMHMHTHTCTHQSTQHTHTHSTHTHTCKHSHHSCTHIQTHAHVQLFGVGNTLDSG